MNIKLETYLESCSYMDDFTLEQEMQKLRKRAYAVCVAMEHCTITQEEADKRYKPIALKIQGIDEIQRQRNIEKCEALDMFLKGMAGMAQMGMKKL